MAEDPRGRGAYLRAERSGARGRIAPDSPERSEGRARQGAGARARL